MLLSLLKILLFFAVILAVALGLNRLSGTADGVQVVLAGTEYTLGPVQAIVALVVLVVAGWAAMKLLGMLWAFIRFVMGDETAINRYFARSRREKGIEALSQGLLAVASGEGKQAQDLAVRAAKYLDDGAVAWVREKTCVNCHTTGPYLSERPATHSHLIDFVARDVTLAAQAELVAFLTAP